MNLLSKNLKYPKFMRIAFALGLFILISGFTHAQITVKGKVTDAKGEAMIGISIVAKENATVGTTTDIDGNYSLSVPSENTTLRFTFLGYKAYEVKVGSQRTIDVQLQEDTEVLDEVVVVGYGVQKKVNLTGSIATIDSKALENRPISNVSAALAGLLPGVTIKQASGLPGGDGGTIRVRGTGTMNNSNPLTLVDGVESSMDNINPNDIESLTVLKDAASAAIYGSKAANGVILVTTKRGKSGKATISYSGNLGWQSPTRMPERFSSGEYAELYNEALYNDLKDKSRYVPRFKDDEIRKLKDGSDPYNYPNTDWNDLLLQGSGLQTDHSVNVTGGSENVRYMASVGYLRQEGIIKHASKNQYNVRSNLDIKPIKKLDVGLSLSYTRMDLEEPTNSYVGGGADQIFRQVNMISPWKVYKDADGNYGTTGDGNPIAWLDLEQKIKKKRAYFLGIGSLKYNLYDGLDIKGVLSYKTYTQDENEFIKDIQYNPNKYHGPNKMYQKDTSEETIGSDVLLTYNKTFEDKHNVSALGGFHSEYYLYKYTMAYREKFPSNELGNINGGGTAGQKAEGYTRDVAMLSWFGRINYDYAGKYLFEANIRYDGSSRFAKENRWGAFPSFSVGWRLSEESFMESLKETVTNLKLRASWGKLGNQYIVDKDKKQHYYPTVPTLSLGKNYPWGGGIQSGGATREARNPNLRWEASRTQGVGFDLGLFNGLNITLDYYDRLTTDIIRLVPTPETYALDNYQANLAKMSNKGVELSIDYIQKISDFTLRFNGNVSYNKNKILALPDDKDIIEQDDRDGYILRVGEAFNSIYGYKTAGLFQNQQEVDSWVVNRIKGVSQPGDLKYVDVSGSEGKPDGILNAYDRVVLGSTDPKYTFGFNVGGDYKGFDLQLMFQGAAGVKGYMNSEAVGELNGDNGNPTTFWRDRWTPENTNTDVPRVSALGKNAPSSPFLWSEYWVQNGTYLRLKNLQLGYTLPASFTGKIGLSHVRFYYSGQNLLTFTSFIKGWDPESPKGRGSHYPQVLVNSFGVNITF